MKASWSAANARRMARHRLTETASGCDGRTIAEVVGAMCGAHAQILSAAEVSIGIRLDGGSRAEVREALWEDRTLIKTYGPRGTVHLLPTAELPMWTGALSSLPSGSGNGGRLELLTPGQIEEIQAALGEILAETELTGEELTEALSERVGSWAADPVMEASLGGPAREEPERTGAPGATAPRRQRLPPKE